MGRYYSGDIDGKFWFGVQSSDDASFFGGNEYEPNYINYSFSTDDMEDIDNGLKKCVEALGDYLPKLEKFFTDNNMYNGTDIAKALGLPLPQGKEWETPETKNLLVWYARYELGKKIKKCVEENGECNFEAEL
jgi:hypothetical protein